MFWKVVAVVALVASLTEGLDVSPSEVTASELEQVIFSVDTPSDAGVYIYTFQWLHEGQPVFYPGATTTHLIIDGVRSSQGGKYNCRLQRNDGLVILSKHATLDVQYKPKITLQPSSYTKSDPGADIILEVAAMGNPPPQFQWEFGRNAIDGADSSALTISSANSDDEGTYSCVVFNSEGFVRTIDATVRLNQAPSIAADPEDVTVNPGENIELAVGVQGSPYPTVQWYKDGVLLPGEITIELRVFQATQRDAGVYHAVVTNSLGQVTSKTAIVEVTMAPMLTSVMPTNFTRYPGEAVVIAVTIEGTAPFQYQWKKGNVAIVGATTPVFTIQSVTEDDEGIYNIEVTNTAGATVASTTIIVVDPPVILSQPQSVTGYFDDNLQLAVRAEGDGVLTYQWKKNGSPLDGETDSELGFSGAQSDVVGDYTVTIANQAGSVESVLANVDITSRPPNAFPPGLLLHEVAQKCSLLKGSCKTCTNSDFAAFGDCAYCIQSGEPQCVPGVRHDPISRYTCEGEGGTWISEDYNMDQCTATQVSQSGSTESPSVATSESPSLALIIGIVGGILVLLLLLHAFVRYDSNRRQRKYFEEKMQLMQNAQPNPDYAKKMQQALVGEMAAHRPSDGTINLPAFKEPTNIPPHQISMEGSKKLGEGAFGEVIQGTFTPNAAEGDDINNAQLPRRQVALKFLKKSASSEDERTFDAEAGLLACLDHPHIVKLIGVVYIKPPVIVMELCKLGSLDEYLKNNRTTHEEKIQIGVDVASALEYIGEYNFVHRDVAARNIFLTTGHDDFPRAKLGDFGLARRLDRDIYTCVKSKVPIYWTAVESLSSGTFTTKSDVWSFGVLLYELWNRGVLPRPFKNNQEFLQEVQDGYRFQVPNKECPGELYELMLHCWNTDPDKRPTFGVIQEILSYIEAVEGEYVIVDGVAHPPEDQYMEVATSQALVNLRQGSGLFELGKQRNNLNESQFTAVSLDQSLRKTPGKAGGATDRTPAKNSTWMTFLPQGAAAYDMNAMDTSVNSADCSLLENSIMIDSSVMDTSGVFGGDHQMYDIPSNNGGAYEEVPAKKTSFTNKNLRASTPRSHNPLKDAKARNSKQRYTPQPSGGEQYQFTEEEDVNDDERAPLTPSRPKTSSMPSRMTPRQQSSRQASQRIKRDADGRVSFKLDRKRRPDAQA